MKKNRAFTLIEILVSIVIVGIGLSAVLVVFMGGRFILKQAESKTRAVSVASRVMEEYLAKSFAGLGGLDNLTLVADGLDNADTPETPVYWRVDVTTQWENNIALGINIPYKVVQVTAYYDEESPSKTVQRRSIILTNIVAYPYIHSQLVKIEPPSSSAPRVQAGAYRAIDGLAMTFNYPVKKNIMVIYNIAIHIDDDTGILPTNTISTGCFYGTPSHSALLPSGIVSVTPITTQPFINNILAIENVTPDTDHTIEIKWNKNTPFGNIRLKEANLIIMATEQE